MRRVGLLIELDGAAYCKTVARHVEAGDVESEEAGKLQFRSENELAHL
jgi:hypothetical protein